MTLLREKKLPRHYVDLAPRGGSYIAISKHDRVVEVLDAKTFEARSSVTLTTKRLHRVVPHPTLPISYITTSDDDVPFILFDELTGEMRQDNAWLGRDMIIDPTGSFMLASYEKWVQVGEELYINGPNVLTTPKYNSIEMMIRYHLDQTGKPLFAEMRDGVGGGLREIVASPDARRVTFLSYAGMSGKTLGGFDALDFKKLAISYGVKEGGDTKSMDYHPVLAMVGSPGKGGAVFFESETGRPIPNRLAKPDAMDTETTYDKLHFSPDGKNALLLYVQGGEEVEGREKTAITRLLVAAPLRLDQIELAQIARGPAEPKPVELPDLPNAPHGGYEEADLHAATHRETIDWIKANSIFGPESELSSDVIRHSGKFLDKDRGFSMIFGGGLTQSGRPTVIAVHQGVFLTQELTNEQFKATGLERMGLSIRPGQSFKNKKPPRRVLLIEPVTSEITDDGKLKGKAILQKIGLANRAHFAMSYTHIQPDGKSVTTGFHHMGDWLEKERSEKTFEFTAPKDTEDKPQLLIGFVQMTTFTLGRGNDRRFPLSDPALLITIHQPEMGEQEE